MDDQIRPCNAHDQLSLAPGSRPSIGRCIRSIYSEEIKQVTALGSIQARRVLEEAAGFHKKAVLVLSRSLRVHVYRSVTDGPDGEVIERKHTCLVASSQIRGR